MDQVIKIMFIIWNRERYKIGIRLSRRVYGFMNIWTYLSEYTTVGLVVRIYVTFYKRTTVRTTIIWFLKDAGGNAV